MDFNRYQQEIKKTSIISKEKNSYVVPTLGLAGESGEVADKVKKILRDNGGNIGKVEKEELKKEIGDVLWYLTTLCSQIGLTLEEVAEENIKKTSSRKMRGKIHGSGDNR